MSLVGRMARPKAMNSEELSRMISSVFGGGSTSSGVSVSSDTAMRQATVYACVKVLYQSIAQMPCHLMEQIGDNKEKALSKRLYRLLHDQPNQWMTAPELWGMSVAHVSLRGDFLAFKVMVGDEVRELLPIATERVKEITQNADYSLTYKIASPDGSNTTPYPQSKILHIRGLSLNGYTGLNPITYLRESIGLGLAGERFLSGYFGKGLHPSAVITRQNQIKNIKDYKDATKAVYAGLANSSDLMVLEDGETINFPPIKLVDAQFLELGKFTQSQICGLFRVPLMLVQAGDAPTTYASAEQFMLAFVTHALTPIVVNIEKAIYRDLLTEEEKKRYFAKFSMAGLLRGDMESRFKSYQVAINSEILCPNEVRDLEDYNAYEGGNEYRTRTSSLKQDGEPPVTQKGKK